jgi:phosphopantetheinyl transferase
MKSEHQDLELKVALEREAQTDIACLRFVHESRYAALAENPSSILHADELKYFQSLSALKRKKDFLLGRYAAKRALLELVPGGSLAGIHIQPGVFQQPIVKGKGFEQLSVCITHSGHHAAVIAFPTGHPVGIDIEWHDDAHIETLSTQVSQKELPLDASQFKIQAEIERYTRVWTVKEALSKILKCGLTTPFSIFEITPDPLKETGIWTGGFENFHQYRFISIASANTSFSLVHPGRTKVVVAFQRIIDFLG